MPITKKISIIILVTAAALGAAAQTDATAEGPEVEMSLQQCLEIAMSDNPTIHVADMEIERVDYSKKDVLGQLLPTISFGFNYNRMLAKQVTYMNMDAFAGLGGGAAGGAGGATDGSGDDTAAESRASSGKETGIKMGLDNSYSMGFSASMPLVAPQLWKSLKLTDAQILQSYEQARQSRLNLVNQVKNAYYGLMLAIDSRKVIKESYEMAQTTADIYEKKFAAGAASEYDVLRTKVAVKNIEPELLQSEIAIKQARLGLAILMGMDTSVLIRPTDTLASHQNTMYEDALRIDRNIDGNPSLRLLDIQTDMLAHQLEIRKMAWYPTLALTANYNWTSMSNGSPFKGFRWTPYSMVGLAFQLPIFQGGQRYNAVKTARIQLDEMKWQRENLTRSINMQVDLAYDNINKNIKQIASSAETVEQAVKAHDIMARSFEIGAASYLNLRDSELALTQSRLSYYSAIYNYLVACSELELLLGNADVAPYMPAN